MLKKISSLPFQGTPEQEAQLKEVIAKHKDDPGAVMPVLQEAQDIYGYLPLEVQERTRRRGVRRCDLLQPVCTLPQG